MLLNEMYLKSVREDRRRQLARDARDRRHEQAAMSPSLRRRLGLSIMRIGARVAMEPQAAHPLGLARSR
jgi:hypothetical protein